MKSRMITESQLRGMIREALNESIQEIALENKINSLRAKGSRRSLQETRRYRKLLEMKLALENGTTKELFLEESMLDRLLGRDPNKNAVLNALNNFKRFTMPPLATYLIAAQRNEKVSADFYINLKKDLEKYLESFIPVAETLDKAIRDADRAGKTLTDKEYDFLSKGGLIIQVRALLDLVQRYSRVSPTDTDLVASTKLVDPIQATLDLHKLIFGSGFGDKGLISKYEK